MGGIRERKRLQCAGAKRGEGAAASRADGGHAEPSQADLPGGPYTNRMAVFKHRIRLITLTLPLEVS